MTIFRFESADIKVYNSYMILGFNVGKDDTNGGNKIYNSTFKGGR